VVCGGGVGGGGGWGGGGGGGGGGGTLIRGFTVPRFPANNKKGGEKIWRESARSR